MNCFWTSLVLLWNFFGTFLELLRSIFGTSLEPYIPYLPTRETFDSWGTDYYSDNWEPEFMTVFVSWQLRVTLDSIRNSCDVYIKSQFNWCASNSISVLLLDSRCNKAIHTEWQFMQRQNDNLSRRDIFECHHILVEYTYLQEDYTIISRSVVTSITSIFLITEFCPDKGRFPNYSLEI